MNLPAGTSHSKENPRELECQEAARSSKRRGRPAKLRSRLEWSASKCREDPPFELAVATVVAERQASAGARDGVKGKRNDLGARAPLHALVRARLGVERAGVRGASPDCRQEGPYR